MKFYFFEREIMILVNTENIAGYEIKEMLGVVTGNVVQSKHIGKDIMAGLKTIVGGEIKGYSEMLEDARRIATTRIIEAATSKGADAIINLRYTTSAISQGMSEILAYGTAVKITRK